MRFLASLIAMVYALTGIAHAGSYENTSYYVAYDSEDTSQYALVLPSVQKVYTHKAGDILNLTQVDADLASFPAYDNGTLCFPSLANGVSGDTTAAKMAEKCYEVDFFYTQKETIDDGTVFILYYKPSDKVYEGLAGQADTFNVVKEGDTITNANSITGADYADFSFDITTVTVTVPEDDSTLISLLAGKTLYATIYDEMGTLESWTFNADLTSSSWQELISDDPTLYNGSGDLSVSGMTMTYTCTYDSGGSCVGEEPVTITVTEVLEDYLLIDINGETIQRLYFNEAEARAYFLEMGAVPTKTISSSSDWNDINTIYSDPIGDAALSGLDITSIKMAQDNTNLYINLNRAGLAFPSSDYYYNYWVYFRAGDDTFSLENFHDGQGNYRYVIYKGIGYQGGTVVSVTAMSANTTSTSLNLVVPKVNLINENADYTVTLFTHGFKDGVEDILGEKEEDSDFNIVLTQ